MKKIICILALLVILVLFLACAPKVTCNKPYIRAGTQCCLDNNGNSVCDTDEKDASKIAEKEAESITQQEKCKITPKQREFKYEKYYTGPLIDTHIHMPVSSSIVSSTAEQMGFEDMPHRGEISTDSIVCLFDSEGITKTFGFLIQHKSLLGSSVNAVKQDVAKHADKLVPFFMPPFPIENQAPDVAAVEEVLKNNPNLFKGYGEARFDFKNVQNALPEDEYFQEMYRLSDEHNLIVQIHPDKGQVAAMERLLQKYPNVIFLVHLMKDDRAEIPRLLKKYPNMYYSLDAEISYIFGYQTIQNNKGPTKETYINSLRSNFDSQLKDVLADWKPVIEAHPDQLTWGSDRWFTWHFDPEVSGLIVEFGRAFIGHLDPTVQEKFAYKNAETMLKNR